jgi:hypothetical protein
VFSRQLNAAMSCILPLYALNRPFIYAGRLRIFSRTDVFLQIYLKDLNSLSLHPRTAYYLESEEEYKTMHTYAPRNQFCHLMAYKYSEIDYHTTVPSHTAISVYQPSKQTNGLTPPSKGVAQIEETWKKNNKKIHMNLLLIFSNRHVDTNHKDRHK